MEKDLVLSKYKRPEDKLLISKFLDKIKTAEKTGKITISDFYNEAEQEIISNVTRIIECKNVLLFGGYEDAERKVAVIFPEKMEELVKEKNFKYDTLLSVVRLEIPFEQNTVYSHGVYLSGLIKLGIKREKVGDILVNNNGADIIVKKEIESFIYSNISSLTRFSNAKISLIKLSDMTVKPKEFKEIKIITSSLRLDNIVSELAKTSRNKASEILMNERVFVNYENETKNTKQAKQGDIITIRGKGKFILSEIVGNTKKGNYVINVLKY